MSTLYPYKDIHESDIKDKIEKIDKLNRDEYGRLFSSAITLVDLDAMKYLLYDKSYKAPVSSVNYLLCRNYKEQDKQYSIIAKIIEMYSPLEKVQLLRGVSRRDINTIVKNKLLKDDDGKVTLFVLPYDIEISLRTWVLIDPQCPVLKEIHKKFRNIKGCESQAEAIKKVIDEFSTLPTLQQLLTYLGQNNNDESKRLEALERLIEEFQDMNNL